MRLRFVIGIFILIFLGLVARLFYWQVIKGGTLSKQAELQYNGSTKIISPRGSIYASDNTWLAIQKANWLLFAEKPNLENPRIVADSISSIIEEENNDIYALLTKPNFRADRNSFTRNKHWNSCWAGKITVSATGDVIPCIFARNHVVSNIVSGLEDAIYNDNLQTLWKITKDSVATCKDCEYRYGCSDCRPLSEDTYGNLYAKNPPNELQNHVNSFMPEGICKWKLVVS